MEENNSIHVQWIDGKEMFAVWDEADMLELDLSELCPEALRAGLGAAGKDSVRDRIILIGTPRNGQETRVPLKAGEMCVRHHFGVKVYGITLIITSL